MGQNGDGNYLPDSGDSNGPQAPSRQPPNDPRKPWLIGCSIAAGAVILFCALPSFALFHFLYDPIEREFEGKVALQTFCRAMLFQDYGQAYTSLSRAARGRMGTEDQFMSQMTTLDQSEGTVVACEYDLDALRAGAVHSDGEQMIAGLVVARENWTSTNPVGRDKPVSITLVHENNVWKVDNADPAHLLF